MKISIITPFHKGKQYLTDYFESLCAQSFRDFEVIFVLDRAEDVSEIVSEYEKRLSLRVIPSVGKGVSAARNTGLNAAKGEFVYFMDADDYLLDRTLELLAAELAENPDLQLIYGNKLRTWYKRSITLNTLTEEHMEQMKQTLAEAGVSIPENADEATLETLVASVAQTEKHSNVDIAESEQSETDRKKSASAADDDEGFDADEQRDYSESGEGDAVEMDRLARKDRAERVLISSRHGLKNISVLHILIRRDFLSKNAILFDEKSVYYADLTFVAAVLEKAHECKRCYDSKYYQRRHNDPINLPSISQQKDPARFDELMTTYEKAVKPLAAESPVRQRLQRKLINYYCNYFTALLHRSPDEKWRKENFERIRGIVRTMDAAFLKTFPLFKRSLIKALLAGNVKKAKTLATVRDAFKKAWKLIKKPSSIKRAFYTYRYLKQPLMENTVMFECFFGRFYSDSPKYLYQQLQRAYPGKYECVWVYDGKKLDIPFPCKQVKRFSFAYHRYLARAKYFVFNNHPPYWMKHRDGMTVLETWHGTPLKRLVFDQEEVLSASPNYKALTYKSVQDWDYLISPNEFSTHTFRRCFMFQNKMLNTGYPRNDILHMENKEALAAKIRQKLGIPENKKTILYAPTWRDDEYYGKGQYKFALKLDLDQMQKELSDEYVVLLRTHYYIADAIDTSAYNGFVYNVCRYDDIAELYLISDILITDYSSVFFDYAGLKRPMLFYTYDLEKYRDDLRGFYISIEDEVPGPLLFTTSEVIDAIQNIDGVQKQYEKRYEEFYERFCGWEDGKASQKIIDYIFAGKEFDNHEECEPDRAGR